MNGSSKPLSKATTVELALVVLIVGGFTSAAVWATRLSVSMEQLQRDVTQMRAEALTKMGDRWSATDMRLWVEAANREVEVWSLQAERNLGVEDGEWMRFEFPQPIHDSDQ